MQRPEPRPSGRPAGQLMPASLLRTHRRQAVWQRSRTAAARAGAAAVDAMKRPDLLLQRLVAVGAAHVRGRLDLVIAARACQFHRGALAACADAVERPERELQRPGCAPRPPLLDMRALGARRLPEWDSASSKAGVPCFSSTSFMVWRLSGTLLMWSATAWPSAA